MAILLSSIEKQQRKTRNAQTSRHWKVYKRLIRMLTMIVRTLAKSVKYLTLRAYGLPTWARDIRSAKPYAIQR
jgi:hypothetical protein